MTRFLSLVLTVVLAIGPAGLTRAARYANTCCCPPPSYVPPNCECASAPAPACACPVVVDACPSAVTSKMVPTAPPVETHTPTPAEPTTPAPQIPATPTPAPPEAEQVEPLPAFTPPTTAPEPQIPTEAPPAAATRYTVPPAIAPTPAPTAAPDPTTPAPTTPSAPTITPTTPAPTPEPTPASPLDDLFNTTPTPAPAATPAQPPAAAPAASPANGKAPGAEDPFDLGASLQILDEPGGWASEETRIWNDAAGLHACEARLAGATTREVVLDRTDGQSVRVPYRDLSDADLQFVRRQIDARRTQVAARNQQELIATQGR